MADATWIVPGGAAVIENADGADWLIPGSVVVNEEEAEAVGMPIPLATQYQQQHYGI